MSKSKMSGILLLVLGILVVLFAVGQSLIEWEWWTFLLILSSMAFVVGLVLFGARRVLR
jgi:predicted membrane protein